MAVTETRLLLRDIEKNFQETRKQLVKANSSMKSLAQQSSWKTNYGKSVAIRKAEQLRIDTVDVGRMYFNHTLPCTMKMVSSTKILFKIFHDVFGNEAECFEVLAIFLDAMQIFWTCTLEHNEDMVTRMKGNKDQATMTMFELERLQKKYEKDATKLREKAKSKDNWGTALCFILPFIGFIPAAFLWSSAGSDRSDASKDTARAEAHAVTSRNVSTILIPAAESFNMQGEVIAGFINGFKAEIQEMKRKCGQVKRHHVIKMKKKVEELIVYCEKVEHCLPPEMIKSLSL